MRNKEILGFIHNWRGLLDRCDANKYLVDIFKQIDFFDFSVITYLNAPAEFVHVYPGISDDYKELKFFVISDRFDRANYIDRLKSYAYISVPRKKWDEQVKLQDRIDDDEARKRIQRWKEAFEGLELESGKADALKVRCFGIPIGDLKTERSRAYFAFKESPKGKFSIDLIIHGLQQGDTEDHWVELAESYDTIRLVPPFPPRAEERRYEMLFH